MVGLINKTYLFILIWACYGLFDIYQTSGDKITELETSISAQQRSLSKSKKSFKAVQEYLKNIDEKKQEIEQVAQEVETLQKQIPVKISDSDNINLIRSITDSLKMRDLKINASGEENRGFFIAKKYKIKAKATYLQLLIFLEKLEESERILNVSDVEMVLNQDNKKSRYVSLDIGATIEAYRYNPQHKEDRGIQEVEEQFKMEQERKKKEKRLKNRAKRRNKKKGKRKS